MFTFVCVTFIRVRNKAKVSICSRKDCAFTTNYSLTVRKSSRKRLACAESISYFRMASEENSGASMTVKTLDEQLTLKASDGVKIGAFMSVPSDSSDPPSGKGVILMSDILGYENEETRAVARRLAANGLPTIVPDLFRGDPWVEGRSMSEYETWRQPHQSERVRMDVRAARDALSERGFDRALGLLGFCFGGGRLMEEIALSSEGLNPKAAVSFYGTRFDGGEVGKNVSCPLLFITGDNDHLVPMDVVQDLERALQQNEKVPEFDVKVYKGLGHAFAHHPKTPEDKRESEPAIAKGVDWLLKHL